MSENIMKRLKVLTKAQFLELPEIDANVRYFITDMPENQIDNADMALAITTEAALYNAGDIFICKDTDTYEKGHIYQLNSTKDAWEDITPASGSSTIIGTTDPTTSTVGTVGQFYLNATTGKLFICKAIVSGSPDTYTWGTPTNLVDTSLDTLVVPTGIKEFITSGSTDGCGIKFSWGSRIRSTQMNAINFQIYNGATGETVKFIYYGFARGSNEMNLPRKNGTLALLEDIVPAFSSGQSYSVGDLVAHSGGSNEPSYIYRCTTSHSGSWNASHFTRINTLIDVINALLDTKQNILTFDSTPTNGSSNPVTSDGIYQAIQLLVSVAQGKTKSYTISDATNVAFNSSADSLTLAKSGTITDTLGNTYNLSDLKVGDIVLITETDVPDRWVGSIDSTNVVFYKMETTKVDLSTKQDKIDSSHKLASDLVNDTNQTHKFVTASEKSQITTNATNISNIKDGQSIDSFGDVETALAGITTLTVAYEEV